jgi:hypothetical protein
MASWLVRKKLALLVMVELLEKATRLSQTASRRPPLPGRRQGRATLRRALFALPAWQSDQRAPAFFAPGRRL